MKRAALAVALATLPGNPASTAMAEDSPAREFAIAGYGAFDGTAGFEANAPESFSVKLPEGNWLVTLTIGDPAGQRRTTVKAESRRLVIDRLATAAGEVVERRFVVNVRNRHLAPPPPNAPGGAAVLLKRSEEGSRNWDDRLTLEFSDPGAIRNVRIEPADVPTIFLAGDSTVTDQRFEPAASWGQMLTAFATDRAAIANHAESGETLKSFLAELRLAKVLSHLRKGDFLFIQFGHNDQKKQWPQTYADPTHSYPAYLAAYIAEARSRGAVPVLVTPPERRNFEPDGSVRETLSEYADAMRRVAKAQGIPLIDLNRHTRALYAELGEARAAQLFNDKGADRTHHNNADAWLLARFVAAEARRQVPGMAELLSPLPELAPREAFQHALGIRPSRNFSNVRPDGN